MKAIVVFDSYFGNAEKIGRAIASGIPGAFVRRATETTPSDLRGLDLLIMGCPTYSFRPSQNMLDLVKAIKANDINGIKVAAFDTRTDQSLIKSRVLRTLNHIGGHAAPALQRILFKKGGKPIIPAEGFLVAGREGEPLKGEEQRAMDWGQKVYEVFQEYTRQSTE